MIHRLVICSLMSKGFMRCVISVCRPRQIAMSIKILCSGLLGKARKQPLTTSETSKPNAVTRFNPGLERAFQPLGFLLPVQGVAIMPKNVVKSVFGSVSARRRAQNVAIRIVHTAIADLFCASQSGSLQIVHLPRDWTTGPLKRSPSNAQQ